MLDLACLYSIMWVDDYEAKNNELDSFKPIHLIEGSTIQIVKKLNDHEYMLYNGQEINESRIDEIRKICKRFENKKSILFLSFFLS